MVHSGVLYISERQQGPPNVAGPGVAYPYPTLSTGLQVTSYMYKRYLM